MSLKFIKEQTTTAEGKKKIRRLFDFYSYYLHFVIRTMPFKAKRIRLQLSARGLQLA